MRLLLLLLYCDSSSSSIGLASAGAAGAAAEEDAADESCAADSAVTLDAQGLAQSYTLSGCSNPSHCGVYHRVDARCLKDKTEGGVCGANPALCDNSPVFQLGGAQGAPVLYRWSPYGQSSEWRVAPSARLNDCESYGALLRSASVATGRQNDDDAGGGAPTDRGFSAGGGWFDDAARTKENGWSPARGAITIVAGGG